MIDSQEGTEFISLLSEPNLVACCAIAPSRDRESLSALGKECARTALHGLGLEALGEFFYTELGAPLWMGANDAVSEVQISIAHTWRIACAVIAPKQLGGIGIDVELTDRNVDRIASKLSDSEKEIIRESSFTGLDLLCAKEATGKAVGCGLAGSIARWQVNLVDGKLCVRDQETHLLWRIQLIHRVIGEKSLNFAIARP